MKKIISFKKAQNQYISWILIFALIVTVSFFLYNWSLSQAKKTGEELDKRTDPLVCAEVAISASSVCQTFRSIELDITNVNNLEIKGVLIRTVGLHPEEENYLESHTIFKSIKPRESEHFSVLKSTTLTQVELLPIADKNKKNIYCEEKLVTIEQNGLKQC